MLPAETLPTALQLWSPFATFVTVKSNLPNHIRSKYTCKCNFVQVWKGSPKALQATKCAVFFQLPSTSQNPQKDIYKTLWKVRTHSTHYTIYAYSIINKAYLPLIKMQGKVMFHEATVSILETGEVTIGTLLRSFSLQPHISPDQVIHQHGALVAYKNEMVHTGDFMEIRTSTNGVSTYTYTCTSSVQVIGTLSHFSWSTLQNTCVPLCTWETAHTLQVWYFERKYKRNVLQEFQ